MLAALLAAALGTSPFVVPPPPGGNAASNLNLLGVYNLTLDADMNSYIYSSAGDVIDFYTGGSSRWQITSGNWVAATSTGPMLANAAASSTVPTLLPSNTDTDTGWGWSSGNSFMQGIINGTSQFEVGSTQIITKQDLVVRAGITNNIGRVGIEDDLDIDSTLNYSPQAVTCADTGDANPCTVTLTPTQSYVAVTCNDTHTCDVTMGETGMVDGQIVIVVNLTANVVDFADTSGVSELTGAIALGQYDSIKLMYVSDRWVQLGTSNN